MENPRAMTMLRTVLPASLLKYLLAGVANTLITLSVIYLLKWSGTCGDVVANLSGYCIGLTVSFIINSRWTFRHSGPVGPAALRFLVVVGVAYLGNLATVLAAIQWIGLNSYLAQALGVPPYVVLGYLGSRHFAFRAR